MPQPPSPDPQVDVDDEIRRHRQLAAVDAGRRDHLVAQWRGYATAEMHCAQADEQHGKTFSAALHATRAGVRDRAAHMLARATDLADAARQMMDEAVICSVPADPPIIGYDRAALRYTQARTWQACAWAIDPELPAVQPLWP